MYQLLHTSTMNIPFDSERNFIETLKKCKELSENPANHANLLKEKTVILFTASLLERNDLSITSLCLDILHNLIENPETHSVLITTFGIFEALESTSIRLRETDTKQEHRAAEMVEILSRNAPPAHSTRSKLKGRQQRKNTTIMYQLYIPNLTPENRNNIEESIMKIKGLVSFVMDIDHQKCTVRLSLRLDINSVAEAIFKKTGMKAFLITKNRNDFNEVYIDILNESKCCDLRYLPDEETPPTGKALADIKSFSKSAGGLFKSAADFLSKSFYW